MYLLLFALVLTLVVPGAAVQVLAETAAPQVVVENAEGFAGTSIPVQVMLLNPGDYTGASFDLGFDPVLVEPVLVEDEVKTEPGTLCNLVMVTQPSPGVIRIAAGGSSPSAAQTVSVCTVYFKLLKAGESAITLSGLELSDGVNNITDISASAGTITATEAPLPTVTVASGQSIYPNSTASRTTTANFSGQVSGVVLPAAVIGLQILDAQVPANVVTSINDLTLDAEGKFTGSWTIPVTAAAGSYNVQAVYNRQTYPNLAAFTIIDLAAPVADPASQQYTGSQQVTLTCATEGAVIYYTLDPQAELGANENQLYSAPIQLDATATIRAIAVKDGVASETVEFTYTLVSDDCFIATASYGSKFKPAVVLLREFRDRFLLTNAPGQAFVAFYYRNSPPFAQFIAGSEMLRAVVRVLLTPLVAGVYLLFHPGLLVGILSIILAGLWWRSRRWKENLTGF